MRDIYSFRKLYSLREQEISIQTMTEERRKKILAFINSEPTDISDDPTTVSDARNVYYGIGQVTNLDSNETVRFVHSAFGKLIRHKEYDPRQIGRLAELFEKATFLWNEEPDYVTPRGDGSIHKKKVNVVSFSHYGTKVKIDGVVYFIRYTVQNLASRTYMQQGHEFHSQQLSEIRITNSCEVELSFLYDECSTTIDYKLVTVIAEVLNYYACIAKNN